MYLCTKSQVALWQGLAPGSQPNHSYGETMGNNMTEEDLMTVNGTLFTER